MSNQLSERIAALRKERGLTQEQLGQLVGVSGQAVSKWEKGGAPDVELLPTLAQQLGVSIDGLFGLEDGPAVDMTAKLSQWLNAIPLENRLYELYRLLAKNFLSLCSLGNWDLAELLEKSLGSSCYTSNLGIAPNGEPVWLRSVLNTDQGLALAIQADNFPFYFLLPEPPEGYEVHFASNEEYRRLFSAMSQEGSLEILRYLYSQKASYYTAAAISKRIGLSPEVTQRAVLAMADCHLLLRKSLELEQESVEVYCIHDNYALVPFLYLARWFITQGDAWITSWDVRERPILALTEEQKRRKKEASHETEF